MKVFVTGMAGFLGSHLADHYAARGETVVGIDNMLGGDQGNIESGALLREVDCRDPDCYRDLIDSSDVVYHCAAAPYESFSAFSPQLVYEHTMMSTVAVLSAAIAARVRRFVFCSSIARYGNQASPFEEHLPPLPVDPYGWAKYGAELALRNLCEIHDVDRCIAVPHNVYGPRQRYVDPYRNVVSIMINRVLQGQPPVIYGDGLQRRSFSYIDDVIGPLSLMGEMDAAVGQIINIGPEDDGITILELARLLLGMLESDLEPVFYPARPLEVQTATCSARKAAELLGYKPKWTLEEGLLEVICWIRRKGPRPFE